MPINGSVVKPTEVMNERESIEAFVEGCRRCASAARELVKETLNPEWEIVAQTFDAMGHGGKELANMRSMSRLETLMAANIKTAPYKPN